MISFIFSWLPTDFQARRGLLVYGAAGLFVLAGLAVFLSAWYVLAILFSITFFVLAFYRPRWIIAFLTAWIPLEPFLLKFAPDEIYLYARYFSEGLIYFLAITIFFRVVVGEKRIKQTPIDFPFVLFLIVLVAGSVMNFVPMPVAVLGARQILRFLLLFFIVVYIYPSRDYIRKLVVFMMGIVVFEALLGIVQAIVGQPLDEFLVPSGAKFFESIQLTTGVAQFWDPGSRVFATLGRYDQLGTFLAFFSLLAVGLWYARGFKDHSRRLWPVLALALPALLLTYSRSSWFGFVLGLLLIGIWFMRDRRVFVGLLVFCGMVAGYLAYSGLMVPLLTEETGRQTVAERFFEAFSYERWRGEYFGIGRLYWMVQTPLVVVRASPLFGFGPGQYGGGAVAALGNSTVYDKLGLPFGVYGSEGYIDNNWFSLWGETGTLGLGFYLWMYVTLFVISLKIFRKSSDEFTRGLALGFLGALVAVALNAFLATFLEVRTLAFYLWLLAGFIVVLGRREKII